MKPIGRRLLLLATAVAALTGCAGNGTWSEGGRYDGWTVVFDGHGTVLEDDGAVVLEPKRATSSATTHGGLVVTTRAHPSDTSFAITTRTEEQIRQGEPNPWEVAWVLWNYQDPEHFYAVALKPGGWEISKQDPAYRGNQRFLLTGTEPHFPIGQDYRVEVTQSAGSMTVSVDGVELGTVTDTERPYAEGSIGLYTEDARVRFTNLSVSETAR